MSLTLNARLAHESKKFVKACDQIKMLKRRISELVGMFSFCDPNQMESANDAEEDDITNSCSNVNLFRESIRQQIENLQNIKRAYFIYANKKADEITRLQCELYGESIREVCETTPQNILLPNSNSLDVINL